MVTHQVHYLKNSNKIILIENGEIKQTGTYDDLVNSGINLDMFAAETEEQHLNRTNSMSEQQNDYTRNVSAVSGKSIASSLNMEMNSSGLNLEVASIEHLNENTEIEDNKEKRVFGALSWMTCFNYFRVGGGIVGSILTLSLLLISQGLVVAADYWVSTWLMKKRYFYSKKNYLYS